MRIKVRKTAIKNKITYSFEKLALTLTSSNVFSQNVHDSWNCFIFIKIISSIDSEGCIK